MILKKVYSFNTALFLAIIILYLHSCAVPALSSQLESFHTQTTNNGVIIGSISFPKIKPRFSSYFIRIKGLGQDNKIAKKNSTEIHVSISQIFEVKHRGQLDNGLTYLFAIERPVGKYEIPSIRLATNNGFGTSSGYSPSFSIPFEVNKGNITYIGNILFNEYVVLNDTVIRYRNNYTKDIEAIKKIFPTLEWDKAIQYPKTKLKVSASVWKKRFVNGSAKAVVINNLTCNTPYEWKIRTLCGTVGVDVASAFSPVQNFTSASCRMNSADISTKEIFFNVYPTIVDDYFTVETNTNSEIMNAQIVIADLTGRTVYKESINIEGTFTKQINVSNLPSGLYFIKLIADHETYTSKIVIE